MTKYLNKFTLSLYASFAAGIFTHVGQAQAAGNNFSDIARNITNSIEELPGLLTAVAYMMGLLLGTLGIVKIKDHVENPGNTPLKEGAIRLVAGGALFALPILTEAMQNTLGDGLAVQPATLNRAAFNVQ